MIKNYYTLLKGKLFVTLFAACLLMGMQNGFSQITFTSGAGLTQAQNFDGMGSSGTATLPSGFKIGTDWSTGTTTTDFAYGTSGTGVVNGTSSGGTINWANGVTASSTDRSLGFLNTNSFTSPKSIVLKLTNSTGLTITAINVAFDYEKSRSGTRQFDWTFFHGSSTAPSTSATGGDESYPADANNTVISNPPLTTSKAFNITGLSIANGADYYFKWTFTGLGGSSNGQGIGIDNLSLTATTVAVPALTVGALSAQFGNVCTNTTAGPQTFTVSGANLTGASVDVGAKTGFSYCLTSGGTYTSTLNLPYSAPTLSSTTVYVKFTPTAVISYTGTIPVTGGGASSSSTNVSSAAGVNTAPTVTSGSASGITATSATVAGTVSSNGCTSLSAYGIEYSTTNGFANGAGTPVSSTNINAGNYTSALSGLSSNTVYYFHAYATNGGGTSYGAQGTFTTNAIGTPTATAANPDSILNFTANWNSVAGASSYRLDVSTVSNFLAPVPDDVAVWTFPNNPDDAIADGGIALNAAATITSNGGTISYTPNGSSTTSCANSSGWDGGNSSKFWQIIINTTNYYNLKLASKMRGSPAGPRDWKVQYKIGVGGTWTDVTGAAITVGNNWTTGVLSNISLPAICANQSSLYIRWIITSDTRVDGTAIINSGGINAIDDIAITGSEGDYLPGYQDLSVNALFKKVTGLTPSTTYYYRVRAVNGSDISPNSNTITVTTLGPCAYIAVSPSSNAPICQGGVLNIFANPTGTIGSYTGFQWSGPSGFTSTNQDLGLVNGLGGTYTVTVTDNNSCTSTNNITVQVDPAAVVNGGGNQNICSGSTVQLAGSFGGSATSAAWATAGDGTFDDNTLVNAVYTPGANDISSGSVVLTLTTNNPGTTCGAVAASITINIAPGIPAQPTAITGAPVSVCPPSGSYTLATTFASGVTYNWYMSPSTTNVNFLSANGSNSMQVSFDPTTNSGYTIRVDATNACGTSNFAAVFVRRSTSVPVAVLGQSYACPGETFTYKHTATTGATSYSWNGPATVYFDGNPLNTAPYVTTDTSVTVTFLPAFTGGTIGVASQVSCFTSVYKNLAITNAPPLPSLITGLTQVCQGQQGVTYSVVNTPGLTYNWTLPTFASFVAPPNGSNVIAVNFGANYVSGSIRVSATGNCGTGPQRALNVVTSPAVATVPRPLSITGQLDALCGTTQTLTANPLLNGASYVWSFPAGSVINFQNLNTVNVTFPPTGFASTTMNVKAQIGCTQSLPRATAIKGGPNAPIVTGTATPCANTGGYVYSVPSRPGVSYSWSVPKNATFTGQGTNQITVQFASFVGNVVCNNYNGCGSGSGKVAITFPCRLSGSSETVATALELNAYPNPATDKINVALNLGEAGKVTIQLMDLSGKIISSTPFMAQSGENLFTVDVASYAKGIYILQVITNEGNVQGKMVIE